jgi:hypothetical protein
MEMRVYMLVFVPPEQDIFDELRVCAQELF